MREEAARIALAAARKIAGAALDAFGAERAAAAVEAAMDALRHQPRLVVKLSPDSGRALKPRIAAMCETHAYAGAVLVRAEPGLQRGRSRDRLVRRRHRHESRPKPPNASTH